MLFKSFYWWQCFLEFLVRTLSCVGLNKKKQESLFILSMSGHEFTSTLQRRSFGRSPAAWGNHKQPCTWNCTTTSVLVQLEEPWETLSPVCNISLLMETRVLNSITTTTVAVSSWSPAVGTSHIPQMVRTAARLWLNLTPIAQFTPARISKAPSKGLYDLWATYWVRGFVRPCCSETRCPVIQREPGAP